MERFILLHQGAEPTAVRVGSIATVTPNNESVQSRPVSGCWVHFADQVIRSILVTETFLEVLHMLVDEQAGLRSYAKILSTPAVP